MHKGSCLCGAIQFTVSADLAPPDACHCVACRKHSGHYFVSTDIPKAALQIEGEVRWFQSSQKVRRGFCRDCGSSLFWDAIFKDWIGVAMGAFDTPTETHVAINIFVSEKGDYYELNDGLPQNER